MAAGACRRNFTYKDGTVRLNALAQAIQADDATLLWLNAETGTVLTAWAGDDEHGPQPADRGVARAWEVVPLESCRLDERHGILTPAMLRLQAAAERREAARKARGSEEREQERLEAEREQAAAAAAARRQARKERLAQERRQRWEFAEKAWLIAEHNGKIPVLLTNRSRRRDDLAEIGVTTVHWKTSVYQHIALAEDWVARRETCQVLARLRPSDARHRKFTDETQVWETLARFVRELGGKRLVAVRNPRQGRPVAAPLAVARAERERAYQNRPAPALPNTSASAASTSTTAFGRARTRARGGADGGRRARAAGRASSGSSGTSAFRSRQRCPHGHPVRAARSHSWSVPHGDASPGLVEPVTPRFRGALPVRLHRPARCAPPSR